MGQSQNYLSGTTNATTKKLDQDFQAAETRAFDHVGQALAAMGGCSLPDLEQAAYSYLCQSFRGSGVEIREEWGRAKASTWADWWDTKFKASRQVRPHTKYSKTQALRGRVVSRYRRGAQADVAALRAQLAKLRGVEVSEIAGEIGRTVQHTRRLLKRTFSRLLVVALIGTFGTGSGGVPLIFDTGRDLKEQSPNVRLDNEGPALSPPLGELADIERIGLQIGDILRSHWASQGL